MPTGYLYEAGVRFLEPRFYNGVLSDSNLTEMNGLRYLRAQMRSSKVSGTDTLPDLLAFNARVKAAVPGGPVPIARSATAAPTFDAALHDNCGRMVRTQYSTNGQVRLDVRNLPNGLYNMRIGWGQDTHIEHIRVTH